jgi:cytochrome P450
VVTGALDPVVSSLGVLAEKVTAADIDQFPVAALREEVIRLASPFRYAVRYARCPMRVGEHEVDEGERVVLGLATANLDPATVDDPLVTRERPEHVQFAFGGGAHYCPGAGIARAAIDAVLHDMQIHHLAFYPERVRRAPELPVLRYREIVGMLR